MSTKTPKDLTVLVIDDEEDVRCYQMDILEDAGFNVVGACDGVEGLEQVKATQPDLLSLDLVMPNKSGIRFLHELRRNQRWKDLPVIVVTAPAHDDLGRDDFKGIFGSRSHSGPNLCLEKPVQPEAYATVVCETLGVKLGDGAFDEDKETLRDELEQVMAQASATELAEALRLLKKKS